MYDTEMTHLQFPEFVLPAPGVHGAGHGPIVRVSVHHPRVLWLLFSDDGYWSERSIKVSTSGLFFPLFLD